MTDSVGRSLPDWLGAIEPVESGGLSDVGACVRLGAAAFLRPRTRDRGPMLALRPGERVLLVGVGTGQDLPLLPAGVSAVGVDLSEPMLRRAQRRLTDSAAPVELRLGDAAALEMPSSSFDAVVLHLVLSVVPDPAAVVAEAMHVLRPGGRAVIFDKVAPEDRTPSVARRVLNLVTTAFGTEIDRRLSDLLAEVPCRVVSDVPSSLGSQVSRGAARAD